MFLDCSNWKHILIATIEDNDILQVSLSFDIEWGMSTGVEIFLISIETQNLCLS